MKIRVSYFRAKDKATGKQMAILDYRRHAARSAVGMKGWQPRDMENYCEWKLMAKYTVDYKGVF